MDVAWQAAVDAGHHGDGDPGPRHEYGPTYYGGFLRDPDGNSAEVVHREAVRVGGDVDHLWVRVTDADASKAFYDTIAGPVGLRLVEHEPGAFVHYTAAADGRGALRLITAEWPTTPIHVAFGATSRAAVRAFHAAAVVAGYEDNGPPGERPECHAGCFGASVLDPDGHHVDAVHHGRRTDQRLTA